MYYWVGKAALTALLISLPLEVQATNIGFGPAGYQPSVVSIDPPGLGAYDAVRTAFSQVQPVPPPDTLFLPSPRGALFRSLVVPGWGQLYNRQPLKVPFIVAGLGVLGGITIYSNNRTVLFRRAAIYHDCQVQPELLPPDLCADPDRYASEFARADELTGGPLTGPAARNLRDQFRRQRDLVGLLTFLAYGMQALDAYVAAELADFDIGEDLVIGLSPDRPGLALRWTF